MGSIGPAKTDATDALFDGINASYGELYAEGQLQVAMVSKFASKLPKNGTVLDIGCASGVPNIDVMTKAGLRVTGIDVSGKMVQQAQSNFPRAQFFHIDAKKFEPAEKLDGILCNLAMLQDPSPWNVRMAYRIGHWLKPGGFLLFGAIDFNEFPVAPGYPTDPTGQTLYHTFMNSVTKDNTYQVGERVNVLRHAGLSMVSCEQDNFDPRPGEIEPEPQCFLLMQKTSKSALLGPYKHPYKHYTTPGPRDEAAWSSLMALRRLDGSSQWNKQSNGTELHVQEASTQTEPILFDWSFDRCTDKWDVARILEHVPKSVKVVILQASPSNDLISIVNDISSIISKGQQHHGALIRQTFQHMGVPSDSELEIKLVPGSLDFSHCASIDGAIEEVANLIVKIWFPNAKDHAFVLSLTRERLRAYFEHCSELGQGHGSQIGFDCG